MMFDITPGEEVGDFEIKAKFLGVEMEKVQLHFQVELNFITLQYNHSCIFSKYKIIQIFFHMYS